MERADREGFFLMMETDSIHRSIFINKSTIYSIIIFFISNFSAINLLFSIWIFATTLNNQLVKGIYIVSDSFLWFLALVILFKHLKDQKLTIPQSWIKKNLKFVLLFILIAFFSIFWSIDPVITAYKFFLLLSSTILGSFIGYRFTIRELINCLVWFYSILMLFCLAVIIFIPDMGISRGYPYYGAWAGIFWNRNYFGSIMALSSSIFLLRIVDDLINKNKKVFLDSFFFLLALILVINSKSATGIIVASVLLSISILGSIWFNFRKRISRRVYLLSSLLLILILFSAITHLPQIFSLLGRNSNLTGRIPMWNILFNSVIFQNPILGYGFGAIWSSGVFREGIRLAVNWPTQLIIADNGFFDVMLSVGIIGLIPFVAFLFQAVLISIKSQISLETVFELFPIIFLVYVIIGNITFSLFFETESFVWMLLIAIYINTKLRLDRKDYNGLRI
jgi:O-antigen ligase